MWVMKRWLYGLLALSGWAYGAFLGSDFPENPKESEPGVEMPRPIPLPRPVPAGVLVQLIHRLEIGQPVSYQQVTVYPLQLRHGANSNIRTMSEAMARDWLEIRELGQARVPVLDVRNNSAHSIFLMSGEIVLGGKQDRVIQQDVLIPPRSPWIKIPVYCVERDRWDQPVKPTFRYSGYLAGGSLRRLAAKSASQDAVWENVEAEITESKARAPTRSYRSVFESPAFKETCDRAVARYRRCLVRQTVGAVVVAGGRVIHCDVFSDPALCAKLWPHITRSYWMDGCRHPGVRKPAPAGPGLVRRFLDRINQSTQVNQATPGAGRAYRIRGRLEGHALIFEQQLVHASLFSGIQINPRPEILR